MRTKRNCKRQKSEHHTLSLPFITRCERQQCMVKSLVGQCCCHFEVLKFFAHTLLGPILGHRQLLKYHSLSDSYFQEISNRTFWTDPEPAVNLTWVRARTRTHFEFGVRRGLFKRSCLKFLRLLAWFKLMRFHARWALGSSILLSLIYIYIYIYLCSSWSSNRKAICLPCAVNPRLYKSQSLHGYRCQSTSSFVAWWKKSCTLGCSKSCFSFGVDQ